MLHKDLGNSEASDAEHLGLKWKEGKRKFTISNKNAGFATDRVYDIMELYEEKKDN